MQSEIIERTLDFTIEQPVDKVFKLHSPEGEKLWVPGWEYNNLMGHTRLHDDYIFTTKNHDHAAGDAIWLVKKYDPENNYIQFYKVEPANKIGVVTVNCTLLADNLTKVEITYKYIGLSEEGNEFVSKFSEGDYQLFISEWKELLEDYFAKTN